MDPSLLDGLDSDHEPGSADQSIKALCAVTVVPNHTPSILGIFIPSKISSMQYSNIYGRNVTNLADQKCHSGTYKVSGGNNGYPRHPTPLKRGNSSTIGLDPAENSPRDSADVYLLQNRHPSYAFQCNMKTRPRSAPLCSHIPSPCPPGQIYVVNSIFSLSTVSIKSRGLDSENGLVPLAAVEASFSTSIATQQHRRQNLFSLYVSVCSE